MFGLGFAEIIIIIIVAVVFLSPKDWVVFIRFFYKLKNAILEMFNDATKDIKRAVQDAELEELKKIETSKEHPLEFIKRMEALSGGLPPKGTKRITKPVVGGKIQKVSKNTKGIKKNTDTDLKSKANKNFKNSVKKSSTKTKQSTTKKA